MNPTSDKKINNLHFVHLMKCKRINRIFVKHHIRIYQLRVLQKNYNALTDGLYRMLTTHYNNFESRKCYKLAHRTDQNQFCIIYKL